MAKFVYVRASGVKKLVKEYNKRCGTDFLAGLDKHIYQVVLSCCRQFNGHRKTLDGGLLEIMTKGRR